MKDRIKKAMDHIEPSDAAKDRMYRNILKKASAQTEEKTAKSHFSPARIARFAPPVAACLCIVVLGVTRFLPGGVPDDTVIDDPPVLEGNPYAEAESAEDFFSLGITLDAPSEAENKQYAVIGGELCEVEFDYSGHSYTLRAAKDGDPSGINGQKLSQEPVENGGNASLDTKTDDTNKNSGKDTPAPQPEPQPTPEPQSETTINVAAIEKTIADAVGADNYLCNTDIEENWLKNYYGFDMSKIEEFIAKQNAISSVNLDTVLVLKVSDDYADTAVELLNKSYDQTVGYIRQYAFGVSKVLNARIYKEGNYVMFILADASYDGEDAEEEEKLAVSEYAKIDAALAKLFVSTPVNLAVVPEDDGNNGGLIFDEEMEDDMPMLGGN